MSVTRGRPARTKAPQLILEEKVFVAILRAAEELQGRAGGMLKRHALTPTQYNALRILRGGAPTGLPCTEVSNRMINRDPDITRLLGRLQRRGLVSRHRDPTDRRIIKTCITSVGLELLKKMDQPVEDFHRKLLGHLPRKRLRLLLELLEMIPRKHL